MKKWENLKDIIAINIDIGYERGYDEQVGTDVYGRLKTYEAILRTMEEME